MSTFGLYLHIPFCVKKCNYCDFLSFPAKEALKDEYVKALAMEMQLWKDKVSNDAVDTIFIGGGTPSLLTEGQFDVLQNEMVKSFHLSDKMEYTIECNPGTVDAEKLKNYKKAGVNRREHYGKMKHPGRKLAKIVLIAIALIVANVALMFHLGFIHWA